jgi:uracil phosphoribosyltransferase
MAYMSKELHEITIETPLGLKKKNYWDFRSISYKFGITGRLPLHMGFKLFRSSRKWFCIGFRFHPNNDDFFLKNDYQAIADFNDKYLLIVDPMLARSVYRGRI